MESINKLLGIIKTHKVITGSVIISLCILLSVIIPFIKVKTGIAGLALKDIDKIIYAKYEKEPLTSKIQVLKEADEKQNQEIDKFHEMMDKGKVKMYSSPDEGTSEMIFIYLKDGRVENAYVSDNMLGFDYGKYWITIEGVQSWIDHMENREKIKIQELDAENAQLKTS